MANETIFVYADGAVRGNQFKENLGAWAYVLEFGKYKKECYGIEKNTTNQVMELRSCIEAMKAIKNKFYPVEIYMDSQYVVSGATEWFFKWEKDKWRNSNGKEIANKELWWELIKEKINFTDIQFFKVKGHSDHDGNNRADELCNEAMDNA